MTKMKKGLWALTAISMLLVFSCSHDGAIGFRDDGFEKFISFDQFLEKTAVPSDERENSYIFEGCIEMTLEQLRDEYELRKAMTDMAAGHSRATYEDYVSWWGSNGGHNIWGPTEKLNLKYYIDSTFEDTIVNAPTYTVIDGKVQYDGSGNAVPTYVTIGNARETMVSRMEEAVAKWEALCDIDFTRISDPAEADANDVVIKIYYGEYPLHREGESPSMLFGRAFFPDQYISEPNDLDIRFTQFYLLEDNEHQRYTTIHELGHALGLRHEMMWTCDYSETSRRRSPYFYYNLQSVRFSPQIDSASIMYYNHIKPHTCETHGTHSIDGYSGDFDISPIDAETVEFLYGSASK